MWEKAWVKHILKCILQLMYTENSLVKSRHFKCPPKH